VGAIYYCHVVTVASEEMARLAEDLERVWTEGATLRLHISRDEIAESSGEQLMSHWNTMVTELDNVYDELEELAGRSRGHAHQAMSDSSSMREGVPGFDPQKYARQTIPDSSVRELVPDFVRRQYQFKVRLKYIYKRNHLRRLLRVLTREVKTVKALARDYQLEFVLSVWLTTQT
jgi:hypothetical protein